MKPYNVKAMLDRYSLSWDTPDGRINFAVNRVIEQLKTTYRHNANSLEYANKLVMMSNREILNFVTTGKF